MIIINFIFIILLIGLYPITYYNGSEKMKFVDTVELNDANATTITLSKP